MFTIAQIRAAHANVKSGADFPAYIRDLIRLGVTRYETFVNDNHTEYFSKNGKEEQSSREAEALSISATLNLPAFRSRLKLHQDGGTDYQTFRMDCATNGINKWVVDTKAMTCVYYDLTGTEALTEKIPA